MRSDLNNTLNLPYIMATIKLTNDVKIASESLVNGIDTSNVLSTWDNTGSYTATQSCYVIFYALSYDGNFSHNYYYPKIDGVDIQSNNQFGNERDYPVPMAKGQVFSVTAYNTNGTNKCRTIIYGLK